MPRIDADFDSRSVDLPNLNRPKYPGRIPANQEQTTPDPSNALAKVAEFRERSSEALGSEVLLAQQTAIADLQKFEQSAQQTAMAIAQRKTLIVASFPSLVDSYTAQYLGQIEELKQQAEQGFSTTTDLNNWIETWTSATLAPNTFTLPNKSRPSLSSGNF